MHPVVGKQNNFIEVQVYSTGNKKAPVRHNLYSSKGKCLDIKTSNVAQSSQPTEHASVHIGVMR